MGIQHYTYSSYQEATKGEPEHVGRVVSILTVYNVKKMSDIWADDFYAQVYTEEGTILSIFVGSNFDCDPKRADVVVDASPEVMAEYQALVSKQLADKQLADKLAAEKRYEEEKAARIKAAAEAPTIGRIVQVVRGRKTPKGTIGVVFWARDGRVGIALSDARDPVTRRNTDVAWLNTEYCVALATGNTPEECQKRIDKSRAAFRSEKVEPVTPDINPEQIVVPF